MILNSSAIVLLSSGLDSTVNLYWALHEGLDVRKVLTFHYGQRSAQKEIERSRQLCQAKNLEHQLVELPWFEKVGTSCLMDSSRPLPTGEEVQIHNKKISQRSKDLVWVPNRNGVFLNIAAAFAEELKARFIIPGFNLEEAQTFPDNSKEYMDALNHALIFSTSNQVEVKCYTLGMNKREIAQKGQEFGVPFDLLWPCYQGGDKICGECESCQRYNEAVREL